MCWLSGGQCLSHLHGTGTSVTPQCKHLTMSPTLYTCLSLIPTSLQEGSEFSAKNPKAVLRACVMAPIFILCFSFSFWIFGQHPKTKSAVEGNQGKEVSIFFGGSSLKMLRNYFWQCSGNHMGCWGQVECPPAVLSLQPWGVLFNSAQEIVRCWGSNPGFQRSLIPFPAF